MKCTKCGAEEDQLFMCDEDLADGEYCEECFKTLPHVHDEECETVITNLD